LKLRDGYDLPSGISEMPCSPAFKKFLWNWFGDESSLRRGDLDLDFLRQMPAGEINLARELVRRNLGLKFVHIIEGSAVLADTSAVPRLRALLEAELNLDLQLTLAGVLWKLAKDGSLFRYLELAVEERQWLLVRAHISKALWLDDGRSIDFLFGLLNGYERESVSKLNPLTKMLGIRATSPGVSERVLTGRYALMLLNELEYGRRTNVPVQDLPKQPKDYRERWANPGFRAKMLEAVHRWNVLNHVGL
jgi:hypothetical protein